MSLGDQCQTPDTSLWDSSTLEDEITMPSQNVRHPPLSDVALQTRRMETSTALPPKPNSYKYNMLDNV
jgi:hypothetical protein